jgi:hypothetical protein
VRQRKAGKRKWSGENGKLDEKKTKMRIERRKDVKPKIPEELTSK